MSETTTDPAARRIFIDKQSPRPYRALLQTSEAVRAAAADAGLERTLALAEATTDPTDAAAQGAAYATARQVLADDGISAAIWVAITINAFNRVSIMSRHPVRGSSQERLR